MRYDEVAEILGVSVKGVEGLMHRAKENLRNVLNEYYKS
jgi:DNA-directed RNA polymerase specialized sigma24 family protein